MAIIEDLRLPPPTVTHRSHPPDMTSTPVTDARRAAADVCADLRSGVLLGAAIEQRSGRLETRDRRWTQELVYGMLRRRGWIDHALMPRVRGGLARLDGDLADLLRLGTYQLLAAAPTRRNPRCGCRGRTSG